MAPNNQSARQFQTICQARFRTSFSWYSSFYTPVSNFVITSKSSSTGHPFTRNASAPAGQGLFSVGGVQAEYDHLDLWPPALDQSCVAPGHPCLACIIRISPVGQGSFYQTESIIAVVCLPQPLRFQVVSPTKRVVHGVRRGESSTMIRRIIFSIISVRW